MIGKWAQQVQITQDKIMASAALGEIFSHILGTVFLNCSATFLAFDFI
jgi:hypothetical protein